METNQLLKELKGTLMHLCNELHATYVGDDAAIVSKFKAAEFALEQNDEQLAKACLQDLGDILKLNFASKVYHQQEMHECLCLGCWTDKCQQVAGQTKPVGEGGCCKEGGSGGGRCTSCKCRY